MSSVSRREFIKSAAAQTATAAFLSIPMNARANPLGLPIGCQTWPVRESIGKDFPGTMRQLYEAGFQSIELCSPVGYSEFGFGGLAKYSSAAIKGILYDTSLSCVSSHFTIEELRKDQPSRIAWAKEIGLTQMLVPSLGGPKNPTMDDVKRAADEYNKMGELAAKSGIQQGLHTEDFELTTVDGKRTYDLLMDLLDPKLVKFQFQVITISKGFDPIEYFTKYPGRFISMHAQGYSAETKKMAPIGQDSLDWKKIFAAAKSAGIKNYFVEMNLDLMKASVPYLRNLQV
ncbi:MAG TPA: TIM barrel protein [Candidatus Dormibacteraeota bacterium]|jgi:sugar phosphate isomerase/epimerase|nr:TIM barrel protein [Candidatus Dormibacteraeota bacterium]